MAFDEDPIVDENSIQSDTSVNTFNALFCQNSGFITRTDKPDFGIDFTVELIRNGRASGNRFAAQLKSAQSVSIVTVKGQRFISYQFKTSRLGLLARQPPGYGVIVLHDDTNGITYYDFVEEIVERLFERDSDNWKTQNTVSIHIPEQNILDQQSIVRLHEFYLQRFENHRLLISQQGVGYGIPDLEKQRDAGTLDPHNPKGIADFLMRYGAFLFNQRDYQFLYQLVSELPLRVILNDSELLFTTAITIVETGRLTEGNFFVSACRKSYHGLDREKQTLIELYSAELDFRLGRTNVAAYQERMRELLETMSLPANLLGTRVRIDFTAVLSATTNYEFSENMRLVPQVRKTIKEINESDVDEPTKSVLILHSVDNLNQLAINIQTRLVTFLRIREKSGWSIPMDLRVLHARTILGLLDEVTNWQEKIHRRIRTEDDTFLSYTLSYQVAHTFLQQMVSWVILDSGQINDANERRSLFESRYNAAIYAFNGFVKTGAYDEAYSALTTALEIGQLFERIARATLEHFDSKKIYLRISCLRDELERPEYSSLVDTLFDKTLPKISEQTSEGTMYNIEPDEEDHFATIIIDAYGLPADRKPNVISEIHSNRKFYKAVGNPNIELLQHLAHTRSPLTMYRSPPVYIAVCKICRYETHRSSDIDSIIEQLLTEHGKSCKR